MARNPPTPSGIRFPSRLPTMTMAVRIPTASSASTIRHQGARTSIRSRGGMIPPTSLPKPGLSCSRTPSIIGDPTTG